jgi:filamentous hemagglutinin family protein
MAFIVALAQAQSILPTNGVVASGAASIRQSGPALSVIQTSPNAIVNWGSFSIGQSNAVIFDQPNAASSILNRVTGSTTSTIAGQMQANGRVYLVNPNGIVITPTGAVQVGGGFVASTLGIADRDFNSGNLSFSGHGPSAGVSNAGSIRSAPGGFVGLIGGTVSNSGVVSVPLGKVAMGSGEQATLNLTGDNFLQVAVPTNAKTADGRALVDVSGRVRAAGGMVQLKAATVAKAIRDAVNVPGALNVSSARASGGSIILSGGPGGNVSVTGRLKASGRTSGGSIAIDGHNAVLRRAKLAASSATGRGGSVIVTGTNKVSLASTAVDASGATGGGAIRIGGDFHGASDIQSAQTAKIGQGSTLNASATASGDGGTVAVWSNGTTTFAGQIAASGGASGGSGGYAERCCSTLMTSSFRLEQIPAVRFPAEFGPRRRPRSLTT